MREQHLETTSPPRGLRLGSALVALALLAAVPVLSPVAPASAQNQPAAAPGVFGEVLDVRVVNIEVVVTDKKGTPVLGLSGEDFRLLVDGEEVPVDYFTEIRGGTALRPETADRELLPGVPAVAPGEPVGTSYLVFIDDFFSIKNDRDRVLRHLADDLAFIGPEDRMAVVAYDGKDLEMLSTWNQSSDRLSRTLRDATLRRANGLRRLAERRQFNLSLEVLGDLVLFDGDVGSTDFGFGRELNVEERAYVERLTGQLNRSIAAATATLRSFAQPPGRKVLLLLSGGWPFIPADFLVGDISRLIFDKHGPYGNNLYSRLSETANLLGYTIYPVDVPGLDREFANAGSASVAAAPGLDVTFFKEQQVHQTLEFLADETGGRAFINARSLDAFSEVVADTRSYYWLGFTPSRAWDDERHDIRIELVNPDLRVRSRSGFLDTSRRSEVNMAVESSLLFGHTPGHGSLAASVGEPERSGRNRMEVPLQVELPLSELTFIPLDDAYASEVEIRIAVIDEDGQQAEMPVIPLQLRSPGEPEPGDTAPWGTKLRLRRKGHRAVVALFDAGSGRILSAGLEIEPVDRRRR